MGKGGNLGAGFDTRPEDINRNGRPPLPEELKIKTIDNKKRLFETYEKWTFIPWEEFQETVRTLKDHPERLKLTTLDVYVIRLLSKGMSQGDGRIEYLLNRMYGTPKQSIEHSGSFNPIEIDTAGKSEEELKKMYFNLVNNGMETK